MLIRQGMRAAYGVIAAVFALGVLVLINVAGWQVLRWYVQSIYATLILLGVSGDWGGIRLIGRAVLARQCRTRSDEDPGTGLA